MLSKWISKLTRGNEVRPIVKTIAKDHLQVRIVEELRGCGHQGYAIKLLMHAPDSCEWLSIGIVDDLDLQMVIDLLQDAATFIAAEGGVNRLPVVALWGKRYFLDGRLSELRNVEDHQDRFELIPIPKLE